MAVPSFRDFLEPLLRVLVIAPNGLGTRQAQDAVADLLGLSTEDRTLRVPNGSQFVFRHRTNWAHDRLKRAGLSACPRRGIWQLTRAGFDVARPGGTILGQADVKALANAGHDARLATLVAMAPARPPFPTKPATSRVEGTATNDTQRFSGPVE